MSYRRGTTLLAAMAAIALGWPASTASADPATLAQIEKAVGVDDIPADYIIMADTSGSMAGAPYSGLKTSLRAFFAALAPADQVTLITFDSAANVVYQGQVGKSPDALIAKLPADADGTATDIGAALEKATDALDRAGAPGIASVVLVTDGGHSPPVGSPYPETDGYAWQQLHRRVSLMSKQNLRAYALPLSGASGASLMGQVFDRPTSLNASSVGEVTRLLETPKNEARKAKLRSALAVEQGKGLTVEWPAELSRLSPGDNDVTLTVRSTTKYLPQDLANISVTSNNPAIQVRLRGTSVSVPPGRTAEVDAVVSWDAGKRSLAYSEPASVDTGLKLSASAGSPWSGTLSEDLGISFQPALVGGEVNGHGSANLGRPWPYWIALLLLIVAVVLIWRWLYQRPMLYGTLLVDPPHPLDYQIGLSGRGRAATLKRAETGEDRPIRARIVRRKGGNRLRVEAGGTPLELPPNTSRMQGSVGFEWLDGSQAARSTAQQPPGVSALQVPTKPAAGATTQWLTSPQAAPAQPTPAQPATAQPSPVQRSPVQPSPVQPSPTPTVPTQQAPVQPVQPPPWPAVPHRSPPAYTAPPAPTTPDIPVTRAQPAPPRTTPAPPPPIDPEADDELPVIDEQIARIE
jgi:hypothetical protein